MIDKKQYKPKKENIIKLKKYIKDGNKTRGIIQLHNTNRHRNR